MSAHDHEMRAAMLDSLDQHDLGLPAGGRTAERWHALSDMTNTDVAVGRLCEAHLDAVAILAEAGMQPRAGALYGVWASVRPDGSDVELTGGRLHGVKSFCSGIGIVDRALIDVPTDRGRQLVDTEVAFRRHGPHEWVSPSSASTAVAAWHHAGLARCNTGTVDLHGVTDVEPVGPPGWYLDRVGFWHGACGPAACWAGGAAGLLSVAEPGDDPFRLAAAGVMAADVWTMHAVLQQAGDEADQRPTDVLAARRRARMVRHAIHELASSVLDRFQRAWGPRPLVADAGVAARVADVEIYLRQHHDARDLAALGADLTGEPHGER